MTTWRRRLARVEQSISPDEVDLLHLSLAVRSAEYAAWLSDEVAAGRLRHGRLSRLVLEAGGRLLDSELDDLLAEMNRLDDVPKPHRPAPHVEPVAPRGYRLTPDDSQPPAPIIEPVATDLPVVEAIAEPARIVRFERSAESEQDVDYLPWDRLEP